MKKRICRIFITFIGILIASPTCIAQKYYSSGEEISLLNESMKLRVTVDTHERGIQITLSFENKGTTEINWAIVGAIKAKDSEVVMQIDDKKEIAPFAEKLQGEKEFKTYQAGTVGMLSTHATKPGKKR